MTTLNPGMTGAKRQSWERSNPTTLLCDALRDNPRASEAEIAETVWETIRNERRYLRPLFEYWFANNYRRVEIEEVGCGQTVVRTRRRTLGKEVSGPSVRQLANGAKEEIRAILMDHVLSNGKLLRDATFRECALEGDWLKEVGKQGKPNAIVGKHLTEKNLWALRQRVGA